MEAIEKERGESLPSFPAGGGKGGSEKPMEKKPETFFSFGEKKKGDPG